jgi:hypothetical protein
MLEAAGGSAPEFKRPYDRIGNLLFADMLTN